MAGLILDSSVIIAAERRGHSVREALEQMRTRYSEINIVIPVVTLAELMHGAYRGKTETDGLRRLIFIDHLSNDIPVYHLTVQMAQMLGRIEGEQAAHGITIAFQDLAIGVTALHLGFEVATLNVRHFQRIPGLRLAAV